MATHRIVFYGVSAYIKEVLAHRQATIWLARPRCVAPVGPGTPDPLPVPHQAYTWPKPLLVNLWRTPTNEHSTGAPDWTRVEVDDFVQEDYPGMTSLGFGWPTSTNASDAGVYLEQKQWALASDVANGYMFWPPDLDDGSQAFPGAESHRYQSTLYVDDGAEPDAWRRYQGFHAQMTFLAGTQAVVTVWQNLDAPPASSGTSIALDLAKDTDHHEAAPLSKVKAVGDVGSLFVSKGKLAQFGLFSPKLPIGLGY
jgi:hypothetical protein